MIKVNTYIYSDIKTEFKTKGTKNRNPKDGAIFIRQFMSNGPNQQIVI